MRIITSTLAICLLLFSLSLANWTEDVDIHVTDASGRPLPNASVSVIYQSYMCDRHELLTFTTSASGIAHVRLINSVQEVGVYPPCVERQYTIRASYLGTTNEIAGIVGKQSAYYVMLPIAEYRVNVKSTTGRSLYPVKVSYGGQSIESLISTVVIELPINRGYNINISYGETSNISSVTLTGDYSGDFTLPVFDLHIILLDDTGERIKGQIKIGNLSEWSLATEDAVFEKFPYYFANFTVIVNNKEIYIERNIDSGNLSLYIDTRAPVISEVSQAVSGNNVIVSAAVVDEGTSASGLASNPILQYVFNDSINWTVVKMYPKSAKVFEGEIPANNRNVVYQIIAEDKQGNQEVYDGRYEFKPTTPTKKVDITKIPSIQEIFSQLFSNISLPHVIGVIVFIFIIILVYRKLKEVV